jgi:hypothetical protein
MKTKLVAIALLSATASTVAFYPGYQAMLAGNTPLVDINPIGQPVIDPISNVRPLVEVVFALDTTGSMSGLINAAKEKIWSIATTLASAQPAPEIRIGLVAYRDRGDAYVTRTVDLSDDLDSVYASLMDLRAQGGGDGPESVNQALHEAVQNISWSQDRNAYQVVFLVGDAPPHMDYQDDIKYPQTIATAQNKGIKINAVQCGKNSRTTREWQTIAQLGEGSYLSVEQTGSAVAIATPHDEQLARLSAELDDTRLYYGTATEKEMGQRKVDASDKLHTAATVESRARRATFNASKSGKDNFLGDSELVDAVASGRVDMDSIDQEVLPESMQAMAPREQKALIAEKSKRRKDLQGQIVALTEKRSDYLRQKVEESGGAEESLDHKIYSVVRKQAAEKGLQYKAGSLSY